jgi:hypothetical protein
LHRLPGGVAMIAKTFILAKEIRALRTKSLRQNKFFRDHGPNAVSSVLIMRGADACGADGPGRQSR